MADERIKPRTMAIPHQPAPEAMARARRARAGDAYDCVVCGLPTPKPRYYCHVIGGGGVALHPDDERLYVPDGGDLSHLPVGVDCLRRNPDLRPYAVKA